MTHPRRRRRAALALLVLAAGWWLTQPGVAASLVVPTSRLDDVGPLRASPEQLKPDECGGIVLHNIVVASGGTATGTPGNDLILGTAGADILYGGDGDDCILGGGSGGGLLGNWLFGEGGNDVLIGSDSAAFIPIDICVGGPGSNTFVHCDVQLNRPGRGRGRGWNRLPPQAQAAVARRLGWPPDAATPTPTPSP